MLPADVEVAEGYGSSDVSGSWSHGRRRAPHGLLDMAAAHRLGASGLLALAATECRRASGRGFRIVTVLDDGYPALLREIPDPPPVLYIWGELEPDDEVRIAVVGSRRASRYGLEVAEQLGLRLARGGVAIVSGLARGIDAAAHRGALSAPGRTISVLGSGLEKIYPREHLELARGIAARGAVLSEYPLDLGPLPQLFPRRNRVISGLCAGVVVVEAAAESGALGTARLALEQGREVYAVPGAITSRTSVGTNRLLCEGAAHVVTRAADVMRELPPVFRVRLGLTASPHEEAPPPPPRFGVVPLYGEELTTLEQVGDHEPPGRKDSDRGGSVEAAAEQAQLSQKDADARGADRIGVPLEPRNSAGNDSDSRIVLRSLEDENGVSMDELVTRCGLPISRLFAVVSTLEMGGLVEFLPGHRVARVRHRSRRFV